MDHLPLDEGQQTIHRRRHIGTCIVGLLKSGAKKLPIKFGQRGPFVLPTPAPGQCTKSRGNLLGIQYMQAFEAIASSQTVPFGTNDQ